VRSVPVCLCGSSGIPACGMCAAMVPAFPGRIVPSHSRTTPEMASSTFCQLLRTCMIGSSHALTQALCSITQGGAVPGTGAKT
jgi:hypothetical protein